MRKSPFLILAALPLAAAGLAAAGLAAAGLATGALAETSLNSQPVDVRAAMVEQINPAIVSVWDISNAAMDETGGIDPAMMDAAGWTSLAAASDRLASAAGEMALAQVLLSAAPGNMPSAEGQDGMPSMEEVQAYINADPAAFRDKAQALGTIAAQLADAARAQDHAAASPLVEELNIACESCHSQFWYPPQE
jgi:cytochrome c556